MNERVVLQVTAEEADVMLRGLEALLGEATRDRGDCPDRLTPAEHAAQKIRGALLLLGDGDGMNPGGRGC
ncbi:MAG: hypothetical protein ACYCW6_21430 [Candidatus Xenobia bacterium]